MKKNTTVVKIRKVYYVETLRRKYGDKRLVKLYNIFAHILNYFLIQHFIRCFDGYHIGGVEVEMMAIQTHELFQRH